jgi:hypothetical protein
MNSTQGSVLPFPTETPVVTDRRSPAWGAIVAGAVAGLAIHLLLLMLCASIGLGAAEPATDENPVATIGIAAAVGWTVSALIALYVAGWVAGRCAARVHSVSGAMHGFLVWCSATIAAALMVAWGAGAVIGGTAQVISKGASALAQPAAGVADLAKQAAEENTGAISSMIDEAAQNPAVQNSATSAAARREIGQAVRHLFRNGGDLRNPQARTETVQALTRAGIAEPDANRMVDGWISSMERTRAQFEEAKQAAAAKAREVSDKAADAMAQAEMWSFIGFILGALAATFGGRRGQLWEFRHTEISTVTSLNPNMRRPLGTGTPSHA